MTHPSGTAAGAETVIDLHPDGRIGDGWHALIAELDRWMRAGRHATFWWRDDDAIEPSAALDRLEAIARRAAVPVALAVIPTPTDPALAARIADWPDLAVIQHGFAHINHAMTGKKTELGADRPVDTVVAELDAGRRRLEHVFGPRSLPVLVPPWNRIHPSVIARLPALGLGGLSTYGMRAAAAPVPGLVQVNTHVDIIDWRGGGGFAGEDAVLDRTVAHLRARRDGTADPDEPTGLLTHHLVHDEACWRFTERFVAMTAGHPATRWLPAAIVFGITP